MMIENIFSNSFLSRIFSSPYQEISPAQPLSSESERSGQEESLIEQVIAQTPSFNGYKIRGINESGAFFEIPLTSLNVRPANLFYRALLGPCAVWEPGSEQLFSFLVAHSQIRAQIAAASPNDLVSFTAEGVQGFIGETGSGSTPNGNLSNLATVFGKSTYRISYGELQSILASQKIYVSSLFPKLFYSALKEALLKDEIVILPTNKQPLTLADLKDGAYRFSLPHSHQLIQDVENQFAKYGFSSAAECQDVLNLTLYQLGALVVKTEDFHVFLDENGKILERHPETLDAIRLVNLCGIRGIRHGNSSHISNQEILKQTFHTALTAAGRGFAIFPAVGMGAWGGDPDLYWNAFLETLAHSNTPLEQIFVNPGHQITRFGLYEGCKGEEFQKILDAYRARYARDPKALANLNKIVNLFDRKTDLVQFARLLKKEFPHKTVSLINASDPDVTLGNHVGEYVNSFNCGSATEENYTALGTNGLCFETITGVHEDPRRIIAVQRNAKRLSLN